ncbi:hypothetical protein ABIA33_000139 [Streptacidiphilus sp. MAP12-16]|uniref:hypothetical protein n=1 Tax=Streptacidiphilus sp. MAP12-16 TaxID=3156300 RepID=UPI003513B7FD
MALSLKKRYTTTALVLLLGGLSAQTPVWAAENASGPRPASPTNHGVATLQSPQADPALTGLGTGLVEAIAPAKNLRLDPMADSAADPLANGLALQPDNPGMAPISTTAVTAPLSAGGGLGSLPLVGAIAPSAPN